MNSKILESPGHGLRPGPGSNSDANHQNSSEFDANLTGRLRGLRVAESGRVYGEGEAGDSPGGLSSSEV